MKEQDSNMTLQDVLNMSCELQEHDPNKTYVIHFKHDLTQAQFQKVKEVLNSEQCQHFGKFFIAGSEVKEITELTIVGDDLQYNTKAEELANAIESKKPLSRALNSFRESLHCSDGFWYGLTSGGYVCPEDILDEESCEKVKAAIKIVEEYEAMWYLLADEDYDEDDYEDDC